MHVVSYKWLSDCFDKKRRLEVEQYLVSREPPSKRPEMKANPLKQKNTIISHPAPNLAATSSKATSSSAKGEYTLKPKNTYKKDDQLIFQGNVYSVVGFPKQEV
jgi:hypothetical protein